jgi:hypothetical protein
MLRDDVNDPSGAIELKPIPVGEMPPMRIVTHCPYCGDAHRLHRFGSMQTFRCEKACDSIMYDPELLSIQVLR